MLRLIWNFVTIYSSTKHNGMTTLKMILWQLKTKVQYCQ